MIKSYPTAIVLSVAVLALTAIILAGPALGVSEDTIRWLLGGEAIGAFALLASMRGLFQDDDGGGE